MALSQGLIDTYWRRYNQRRALTGLPSSYQETRGTLDPMMEATANKDIQESQLRYQNERANKQLSLQEQAQKDASRAATISGIAQTGGILGSGYLGYQGMQNSAAANSRLLSLMEGGKAAVPSAIAPSVGAGSAGILPASGAGGGALTAPGALSAPGYTAPMIAGPTSFEAGAAAAPAAASSGVGAGSALLAGAPQIAAVAGAQYYTGKLAKPWMDEHGLSTANKGWTYAGLPGLVTGGMIDVGKKAFDEIGSFASDVFGW